jgi:hypothetical protein
VAFNSIPTDWIQVGKALKQSLFQYIKDNFDWLYTAIGAGGQDISSVSNGSFEIDSDADGIPDNWTRSLYPGGSQSIETTYPLHGAKTLKFVRALGAGNGGGFADSDYIPISKARTCVIGWLLRCSAAGVKVLVQVRQFTKDKIEISDAGSSYDTDGNGYKETVLYVSTANPTGDTFQVGSFTPQAGTRFIKVRLVGGYTDTDVAGEVYFDNVELLQTGAEAVIGWASGAKVGNTVTIDGTVSSPTFPAVMEAGNPERGAQAVFGARKHVAGGRNVTVASGSLSVVLALPGGLWTVTAFGWGDAWYMATTGALIAVARRDA